MFQDFAVVVDPALLHTPSFMVELNHASFTNLRHGPTTVPTYQLPDGSLAYRLNGEVLT